MRDPSLAVDVESLLEERAWVRELSRSLARSGVDADDLEQATWLAALEHRPSGGRSLRGWLATVLRNAARQERRAGGRRAAREADAARAERLPSTAELLGRAEMVERLAAAVRELAEPYRTAILLRYIEGLPPRRIAARLEVPVATVRTRIARGLAQLRSRLDRDFGGDRHAWIAALAPFARAPLPPYVLVTTLAMNAKLVASIVIVLSLAAVGWWLAADRDGASEAREVAAAVAPPSSPAHAASASSGATPSQLDGERAPDRAAVAPAPADAPPAVTPPAVARAVRGRVLDATGAPAPHVRLVARALEPDPRDAGAPRRELVVASDASGAFEIADAPSAGVVVSGDAGLATVMRARFHVGGEARESIVVVAPRIDLAGLTADETGAPLAGAEVSVELPEDFRSRFREVLDASATEAWTAASDESGAFELDAAPAVEGARLVARLDGFSPCERALPQTTDVSLRLVLARPRADDGWVRGLVIDGGGEPIAGAHVAFGIDTARTPPDGTFAFEIDDPRSFGRSVGFEPEAIVAVAPGRMPARYEPPVEDGRRVWPKSVTLRLAGETLSIAGRVVGAQGESIGGARVYVEDATLFGAVDGGPRTLEGLLAGSTAFWSYVETDGDGRFELGGLLDREYVLRAHDPRTLLRADSDRVRAGRSGVEIRIPTDQLYPRVAGRVLSHAGTPIEGATVHPMCDAFQARFRGQVIATSHDAVEGTRTDAEGRFALRDVPRSLVYLRVDGESILPLEYGRHVEGDPRAPQGGVRELPVDRIEDLELRVELRCHVRVELADAGFADELAVLDAAGKELVISLFTGEGRRDTERHPLHDGRSDVLGVPDTGATLVLFKNGVEVARTRLAPDPSQLVTVRL